LTTAPQISVIITSDGPSAALERCLESLSTNATTETDLELVLVVASGAGSIEEHLRSFRGNVRVMSHSRERGASARNVGGEAANGSHCLFIDEEVVAGPDLVGIYARALRVSNEAIALGRVRFDSGSDPSELARFFSKTRAEPFIRLRDGSGVRLWRVLYPMNFCVPRSAFLEAGGFASDDLGVDAVELGYRLQDLGLPLTLVPDAVVTKRSPSRFRDIANLIASEGSASVRLYKHVPRSIADLEIGSAPQVALRALLFHRVLLAVRCPIVLFRVIEALPFTSPVRQRWHQFLDHHLYWRGVRRRADPELWRRLKRAVAVLMYHRIGDPGEQPAAYVVPLRRFRRQMAWLRRRKYNVMTLGAYVEHRRKFELPPAKSVVVTFDDGFEDNARLAYPVLRRYELPATMFVVTSLVGGTCDWTSRKELARRPLFTWNSIRRMHDDAIEFGAHTRTHPNLTTLSGEALRDEIVGSRQDLQERNLGLVDVFAYPFGAYGSESSETVERAGFRGACTVHGGLNFPQTPDYELRRVDVRGRDSLLRFALAVWSGNSWLLPMRRAAD
jgi:peptidoglycan/xylan/chitin deacetylase (PgdA/CDA1 family)/GT2 family glycosyltransferase